MCKLKVAEGKLSKPTMAGLNFSPLVVVIEENYNFLVFVFSPPIMYVS